MSIQTLIDNLDTFRDLSYAGIRRGLHRMAPQIETSLVETTAHGDITGATRASYSARVVGFGETGAARFGQAVAAVETLNPGHVATEPISMAGPGIVLDTPTDYQHKLETENAGAKATLGPTLGAFANLITAAVAAGSAEALS